MQATGGKDGDMMQIHIENGLAKRDLIQQGFVTMYVVFVLPNFAEAKKVAALRAQTLQHTHYE